MTIQEYCTKKKTNISKLAEEIGCSQPHLSMVARGITNPSFKLAIAIEKYTNKLVPRTIWYPNE